MAKHHYDSDGNYTGSTLSEAEHRQKEIDQHKEEIHDAAMERIRRENIAAGRDPDDTQLPFWVKIILFPFLPFFWVFDNIGIIIVCFILGIIVLSIIGYLFK